MKCAYETCNNEASHAPKICVPATGCPIGDGSLSLICGIQLCIEHAREFGYLEMIADERLQNVFAIMARASGSSIPPDFERTFMDLIPIEGEEFQMFEGQRKRIN